MALLDRDSVPRCWHGHVDCRRHKAEKPNLTDLPGRDLPKAGKCWCGEIGNLWKLPLDGRWYCRRCIRQQLRVATYPNSIRFPDEA